MGSFLRRLTNNEKSKEQGWILKERSVCDHCKQQLGRYELIPLLSWIVQWWRCRSCNASISRNYLRSELLCWVAFCLLWWVIASFPLSLQWIMLVLLAILIYVSMIDIKKKELSILGFVFACCVRAFLWLMMGNITFSPVGYATYSGIFALSSWIIRSLGWLWVRLLWGLVYKLKTKTRGQWFGFGDVLFGWLLWLLLPLLFLLAGRDWLYDAMQIRLLVLYGFVCHMFLSSIAWIIWFLFFQEQEELPFIPYMLWWFFLLAIAIILFSDYIISFLIL